MTEKVREVGTVHKIKHNLRVAGASTRRRFWQRWHNPNRETTPVFLIGGGRSGTTMLVHHLGRSWQVDAYNEDHPAAFQQWHLRDLSEIEAIIAHSYARVALFKPILDTYRAHIFLPRFPTAKALFAFRHYDDVINSSLKKLDKIHRIESWVNTDFAEFAAAPPPEATKLAITSRWKPALSQDRASCSALNWLFRNRLFFDLNLHQNERIKLVRYEPMVSESTKEFRRICRFINIQFEPRMVDGIFSTSINRRPAPVIDPDIRAACEEMWQQLCDHYQTDINHEMRVH